MHFTHVLGGACQHIQFRLFCSGARSEDNGDQGKLHLKDCYVVYLLWRGEPASVLNAIGGQTRRCSLFQALNSMLERHQEMSLLHYPSVLELPNVCRKRLSRKRVYQSNARDTLLVDFESRAVPRSPSGSRIAHNAHVSRLFTPGTFSCKFIFPESIAETLLG